MKFLLVITCIAFAAHIFCAPAEEDEKIVGGKPVSIKDFPYQLSLRINGFHACGASILTKRFAITAAHCTIGQTTKTLSVRAGSTTFNEGGVTKDVAKIYQHPKYNPQTYDYDVSILYLSTDLKFSDSIKAIKLCTAPIPIGQLAWVSGWGSLKENDTYANLPKKLQAVQLPAVSKATCRSQYGDAAITNRMICAGYTKGGKDSCQGDSGGPLAYNKELCGIVSWGTGCARPNFVGVYTDVNALKVYITDLVKL